MIDACASGVYRFKRASLKNIHKTFDSYRLSDRYERAVQDPEYVEIDKQKVDALINFAANIG